MTNELAIRGVEETDFATLLAAPRTINTALLPLDTVKSAIAALNTALEPIGNTDEAVKVTALLVGSYPRHAVDDPEIYTRAIKSVFAKHPRAAAMAAIDALTLRLKFIPTRAEVSEELERLTKPINDALASARWMAKEHARRADEAANERAIEASKAAFREKHGGKSVLEVLSDGGIKFAADEPNKTEGKDNG